MAASYICLAVKQQYVEKSQAFEELAEQSTGQEKMRLKIKTKQTRDRALFYLRQGLRASEGAYCPSGETPSKESLTAYEKAITSYVKKLSI